MNLEDVKLGENFISQMTFTTEKRQELKEKGQAMPHGGYPIRNRADLKRAIQAFGRAKDKEKTKAWIIKRAKELDAVDLLPDDWVNAKQSNLLNFIKHHGVKGMQWGVRKSRGGSSRGTERTTFGKSPSKLTNAELERRIKRMETEKKYNELNSRDVSRGQKFASEIITNVGRTTIQTIATGAILLGVKVALSKKFGPEVASAVTKRGKK